MPTIKLETPLPHRDIAVHVRGNTISPTRALLLFHGRGATAENILGLYDSLSGDDAVVALAPEAAGREWYPHSFLSARQDNEPYLSAALTVVQSLIDHCREAYKLSSEDLVLVGFSQGACLVAQYVAENPARYAGVGICSGGLIGNATDVQAYNWEGSLAGTPVYLGCDPMDPFIPEDRVRVTGSVFEQLGGAVTERFYPGLGHSVHPEAVEFLQGVLMR